MRNPTAGASLECATGKALNMMWSMVMGLPNGSVRRS
jgi:hypothetical protein